MAEMNAPNRLESKAGCDLEVWLAFTYMTLPPNSMASDCDIHLPSYSKVEEWVVNVLHIFGAQWNCARIKMTPVEAVECQWLLINKKLDFLRPLFTQDANDTALNSNSHTKSATRPLACPQDLRNPISLRRLADLAS
jgi:hypothetical protein